MRIRNKEIRRRRHRKEKVIKAAVKEAKTAGKVKTKRSATPAEPKPKAAAKKAETAAKKPEAERKKAPAKRAAKKKTEEAPPAEG